MKRLVILLGVLALLCGCGRKMDMVEEHAHNEAASGAVYTITIDAPEGAVCETFERGCIYTAENGDYCVVTEEVAARTLEEAITCVSGFSPDALEIVALSGDGVGEYHFAWASCSGEGELLSRCALYAADGRYYAVTMTQASACGSAYRDIAEAVFSTVTLESEMVV